METQQIVILVLCIIVLIIGIPRIPHIINRWNYRADQFWQKNLKNRKKEKDKDENETDL